MRNSSSTNQTYYFIPDANKYHLALLNSRVINFYFMSISPSLAVGALRWIKQYVEQIPIPKISKEQQKPFETLVDKILKAKEQDPQT